MTQNSTKVNIILYTGGGINLFTVLEWEPPACIKVYESIDLEL